MNSPGSAMRNSALTWTLSVAVLILGWRAFERLPRLEDPEIAIREARVITAYPGASAAEVEREVADRIELAARGLDQVRRVESFSSRDGSVVSVQVKGDYDKHALPRLWDDLRRRIDEVQPELPPGTGRSIVDTGLGDHYGSYYALAGEGFTPAELKRVAERLGRGLSTLDGVKKAILFGAQREAIYIEISRAKTDALGVSIEAISEALRGVDPRADAGRILVGPEHVPIDPGGLYQSAQDLGGLMIAAGRDRLIRLGDVAEIRRDYEDPPRRLLHVDGRPAIGIAVSAAPGRDLVTVGNAVDRRLAELSTQIPLGMELQVIARESEAVARTMSELHTGLALALALVMAALLLVMGLRGGLLVGVVTLLTMAGTFLVMDWLQIALERVSLGALIISVGLIPGNAILVVDGIRRRTGQGQAPLAAARKVVAANAIPLLGATAVTVLAFAPIAGMDNDTGEQTRALFLVVLISLAISWVTALTIAPRLAERFLDSGISGTDNADADAGIFHRIYSRTLAAAIRRRWIVPGATALLLALSLYGFGFVKQTHFPVSAGPGFLVEVYFREGTHIRETERRIEEIEAYLRRHEGITRVATAIGAGHPRFLPSYGAGPDVGSHYSASLVTVGDQRRIDAIGSRIQADLDARLPDAVVNVKRHIQGTGSAGGRIQLRIGGPDPSELRRLADRVKTLIASDPDAKAVRDDWGAKIKVAHPVLAQERALRLGIDRAQISAALRTTYSGTLAGLYPDGTGMIPIVARAPREERGKVEDMTEISVTSPLRGDRVSLRRLIDRLDTRGEDARRSRRDGVGVIRVHADAKQGPTSALLERIKPQVEKALDVDLAAYRGHEPKPDFEIGADSIPVVQDDRIPLKGRPGYFIAWGGEVERSAESRAGLRAWMPLCFGLMLLVLVALFNGLRQPLIILLAAPPAIIGVTAGLLLTGRPFDFMSLLGLMGLSGILIGNAILLVDGIGKEPGVGGVQPTSILVATSSRLRPVGLAAGTVALAVVPLLRNDLFGSMAVTILSGLGLASLLIPVLVPLLYATLFQARNDGAS